MRHVWIEGAEGAPAAAQSVPVGRESRAATGPNAYDERGQQHAVGG
jgi:hypothetical protein